MIFKMFRSSQEPESSRSHPDLLWAYPLDRLVDKQEPFADLEPPGTNPNSQIKNMCITASLGYILFLYYAVIEKLYGAQVAQIVRREHVARLDLVAPDSH